MSGFTRWCMFVGWAALVVVLLRVSTARAADPTAFDRALRGVAAQNPDDAAANVAELGELGDAAAIPALEALCDERLEVASDGSLYIEDEKHVLHDAISGAVATGPAAPSGDLRRLDMNNALRRAVLPVLARLKLNSPDPNVRRDAANELAKRGADSTVPLLRAALAHERDGSVRDAMAVAIAKVDIGADNRAAVLSAIETLGALGDNDTRADLATLASGGRLAASDETLRTAAASALGSLDRRGRLYSMLGELVHGVSLASVLLFAALGLAITFGVMGVINMAHGEMLMIGAYTTYAVQVFFERQWPTSLDWYLLAAVPLSFVVTFLIGVVLERVVIRHLYGRHLETLLATWGISLILIQTVRLIFGAQNVAVANPKWLAGGTEIAHGVILPYSRVAVVAFVVAVSFGVWMVLWRTPLGLQVRAITQNRSMAACLGVATKRVDMWIFGLGSGIAGLGGVALSQLGNVGPELGQAYIIDSFMVVVLGGVGRLAGTVASAVGLGILNKMLEPYAGAVMGKIVVLLLIIVFIQRRPQGMFALKGRVEA